MKLLNKLLRRKNAATRFFVKLKRQYRIKKLTSNNQFRLEISGGSMPLSDLNLNIDILDDPAVDIVTNLLEPLPFNNSTVDQIISVATLEHFNVLNVRSILNEFQRILKPNGKLIIGVPSFEKIVKQYQINGCDDKLIRYLHGAQKDEYDIHLFIVDAKRFTQELEKAGFVNTQEQPYDFERHDKNYMMKIITHKAE